jgi:hypothetical protein
MVEKTSGKKSKKENIDFNINASEIMDITLTEEESENLINMLTKGPNKKAEKFSIEALKFYEEMVKKTEKYNKQE